MIDRWFLVSHLVGFDAIKKQKLLIDYFESTDELLDADNNAFYEIEGLNEKDVFKIINNRNNINSIIEEYESLKDSSVRYISIDNEEFPDKLLNINNSPTGIYVKGKLPSKSNMSVGIVGARECSPYGMTYSREISEMLSLYGVEIISGLARGVDGFAHKGAIKSNGITFAILAGGVNYVYPRENEDLYYKILESGGIISEYPNMTVPDKYHFPLRNRIISGLSDSIILIEAKKQSGALITADYAIDQGRDVFVLPGRLDEPLSEGCNQYIRQGAGIISSMKDLLEDLGIVDDSNRCIKPRHKISLEKEELLVYSCLRLDPIGLDEIVNQTGLKLISVIEILSNLVDKGFAEEYFMNRFIRSK